MKRNLFSIITLSLFCQLSYSQGISALYPTDNPVEKYHLEWTDKIKWENVRQIDPDSEDILNEFYMLQDELVKSGGGIVFFPSGEYHFKDHILLEENIVIRGAKPSRTDKYNPAVPEEKLMPIIDARDRRYELTTKFIFPEYDGKDRSKAFKGIRIKNAMDFQNNGVIDLEIINGHIALGKKASLQENVSNKIIRGNIIVYGNIIRNAAVAGDHIPFEGQNQDQIWMDREMGAITVYAGKNILVANNRIPKSGDLDFLMEDFLLYPSREAWQEKSGSLVSRDIWFDYDNRTGIRVNFMPIQEGLKIWTNYPEFQKAWDEKDVDDLVKPGSMAKGIVIRDNYVFSTGKGGIKSTGWGTWIGYNVIRCFPEYDLPSHTGQFMDAFVNDMRAIEVRGWEWTIEANDFEVYSNYTPEGIKYNDGEGLMHESWENIGIRNSVMRNNVGNQYLCFWRIPVDGLLIEGNRIRTKLEWHAIFVNSQARFSRENLVDLPVNNVIIRNNITEGGGIKMLGTGETNSIEGNQHVIPKEAKLIDTTGAKIINNTGYIIE